jgi:gentisate 1,2-dioxygenase
VLLTPNWAWHGHNNESDACAYWIDFLDAPLVQLLEPMFLEPFAESFVEKTEMVDEESPFRYAFSDVRQHLGSVPETQPGLRDLLLGPKTLDTLDLHVLRLDAQTSFSDTRSTANSVFAVMDGQGTSVIDDREFDWSRGDVFVVPSWNTHGYKAETPSYLLRVTDEPVMKCFNWLRHEA